MLVVKVSFSLSGCFLSFCAGDSDDKVQYLKLSRKIAG
jgi:hypothetical protein